MMIIIFILAISILSAISKAATVDCIGGFEGPDTNGLCHECPVGKVSGNAERKEYDGNDCLHITIICGPGQFVYHGMYGMASSCMNAWQDQYCPNGRCLYEPSGQYSSNGANSCPYETYTEQNPNNVDWQSVPPQVQSLFSSTGSGSNGAIRCTGADTQFCPSGTGSYGSGVIIKGDATYKGQSIADQSFRSFFYPIDSNPAGCYNCTAGTYQSGTSSTGSLHCALCPPGKYSPAMASECATNACPAGFGYSNVVNSFFTSEERACKPCAAGFYNDGSHIECQECPRGKASIGQSSTCKNVNVVCDPGQYVAAFKDKNYCSDVSPGKYCYNGRCLFDCSALESSTGFLAGSTTGYITGADDLSFCQGSQGSICPTWSEKLDSTYQSSMACTSNLQSHNHSAADCPPGSFGYGRGFIYGCYPCKAGQYRRQSDPLGTCSNCPAGKFSAKGSAVCSVGSSTVKTPTRKPTSKPVKKPRRRHYVYQTHSPVSKKS